jgi:hypothetical protein
MEIQEPKDGKYEVGVSPKILLFSSFNLFSRYLRRAKDRQLNKIIVRVGYEFNRFRAVFESSANRRTKEGCSQR